MTSREEFARDIHAWARLNMELALAAPVPRTTSRGITRQISGEPMTDLSLVPTDELVRALERRSVSSVVLLELPVKENDTQRESVAYFNGSYVSALGLANQFIHRHLNRSRMVER